jgi:Lysozyme inhibitor LprI
VLRLIEFALEESQAHGANDGALRVAKGFVSSQVPVIYYVARPNPALTAEKYDRVRKVLSAEEQKELQAAQQLWLQFRDANCAAERHLYERGTAAPMVYAACMEADTRQRTAELNRMYGWRVIKFSGSALP